MQRAWSAGLWAKATLEGRIPKTFSTPKLNIRPTVYIVVCGPGITHHPVRVGSANEVGSKIHRIPSPIPSHPLEKVVSTAPLSGFLSLTCRSNDVRFEDSGVRQSGVVYPRMACAGSPIGPTFQRSFCYSSDVSPGWSPFGFTSGFLTSRCSGERSLCRKRGSCGTFGNYTLEVNGVEEDDEGTERDAGLLLAVSLVDFARDVERGLSEFNPDAPSASTLCFWPDAPEILPSSWNTATSGDPCRCHEICRDVGEAPESEAYTPMMNTPGTPYPTPKLFSEEKLLEVFDIWLRGKGLSLEVFLDPTQVDLDMVNLMIERYGRELFKAGRPYMDTTLS